MVVKVDVVNLAKAQGVARMRTLDRLVRYAMGFIQTAKLALRTWHDRTSLSTLSQATNVTGAATE